MKKFLLVYDTIQGQTGKIAHTMEFKLRRLGHAVDVYPVSEIPSALHPEDYAGVIIGAPVHAGGYPRVLKKWVSAHADALSQVPSAFFSVCLGVLQKEGSVQRDERDIVRRFFETTRWEPRSWTIFAGALTYSKYNWFLRRYMRMIARRAGGDTDMTNDYEYTNWDAVRSFTREFARIAAPAPFQNPPLSASM